MQKNQLWKNDDTKGYTKKIHIPNLWNFWSLELENALIWWHQFGWVLVSIYQYCDIKYFGDFSKK
jgi:hypothetical protein